MLLENSFGERITPYCILDSDYHTEEEKNERMKKAVQQGVQLHIWARKEIENYLLVSSAIHRLIHSKIARRTKGPSIEEVEKRIEDFAFEMESDVFDALSTEILGRNHSLGAGKANKIARDLIRRAKERNYQLHLMSGKELISKLSMWSQSEFGVSIGALAIAASMTPDEILQEIKNVVNAIEMAEPFPKWTESNSFRT